MALLDHGTDIVARFITNEPVPRIADDYEVTRAAIYLLITKHFPQAKAQRAAARLALYAMIRAEHAEGETIVALSRAYGLSRPRIHEIVHTTS